MAGKGWMTYLAHCRAICMVCRQVAAVKARVKAKAEAKLKMLEKALASSPLAQLHRIARNEHCPSPMSVIPLHPHLAVVEWVASDDVW